MKRSVLVVGLVFLVLILDQALKIWVKTHMEYGEEIPLFGEFGLLHFVENNGMAFGISIGGDYGKLALSLFRIIAVSFLVYYLGFLIKQKANFGLLVSFALILAGAVGNIIDSAFYGLIFSESPYHGGLATLNPVDGGYAGFLHGKVVDMLYFPLFSGHFPDWLPIWGGEYYLFFRPVFNIADMSITIGVLSILLFHRNFFSGKEESPAEELTNQLQGEASGATAIAADITSPDDPTSTMTEPNELDDRSREESSQDDDPFLEEEPKKEE